MASGVGQLAPRETRQAKTERREDEHPQDTGEMLVIPMLNLGPAPASGGARELLLIATSFRVPPSSRPPVKFFLARTRPPLLPEDSPERLVDIRIPEVITKCECLRRDHALAGEQRLRKFPERDPQREARDGHQAWPMKRVAERA